MWMRRSSTVGALFCLCVVIFSVHIPGSCHAGEDVLSKIREAQQRREAMISSVHFLVKSTTTPRGGGPLEIEQEWYVERDRILRIESHTKLREAKHVVLWHSTDGNWNYQCNYWLDEPGKIQTVLRRPANPRELRANCPLLHATGESLTGFQENLGTLLRQDECEVLADDKRIENCVRVRLGTMKFSTGKLHSVNVWFDIRADFLPRFYVVASEEMTNKYLNGEPGGNLAEGEIFLSSVVLDYQEWHDPITKISIKFPWHTGFAANPQEIVILSVNNPLSPSRLVPPMDRGVEIVTNPNTPQQSSNVVGDESDAQNHFARSMTASAVQHGAASVKSAQEAPLAVAEQRSFFAGKWIWLAIASVVAVIAIVGWRIRAR